MLSKEAGINAGMMNDLKQMKIDKLQIKFKKD